MTHPFEPHVIKDSKSMIIGTLPPEGIEFYYSNSPNNRMWDILKSILDKTDTLPKGSYILPTDEKKMILSKLNLSMADIIYEYEREKQSSKDTDIIPVEYFDIKRLINNSSITNLLFVYKSAAIWFLESLEGKKSVKLSRIKRDIGSSYDTFHSFILDGREINCILLPNPLSRGAKGWSLNRKKEVYEKQIIGNNV